jgi:carbohydrate-selective porin OprB
VLGTAVANGSGSFSATITPPQTLGTTLEYKITPTVTLKGGVMEQNPDDLHTALPAAA